MPTAELQVRAPDLVRVQRDRAGWVPAERSGVRVTTEARGLGRAVVVAADGAEGGAVSRVQLRWRLARRAGSLVLGDAWERSYGDLAWNGPALHRGSRLRRQHAGDAEPFDLTDAPTIG